MSRALEVFKSARQRINPEGLALSASLMYVSPAVMIPVQVGLTCAIHELGKETDPDLLKLGAISILSLANIISIGVETRALTTKEYCASPIASALNILTDRPLISSFGGHLANYLQLSILNPINFAAIVTQNHQLLLESEGATSLALTLWLSTMNTLIVKGKTQPVVDGLNKARQLIVRRFKKSTIP